MRRYEIYLPLKHNDGKEIEAEKIQRIKQELVEMFGAVTVSSLSSPNQGTWKYGGVEYIDDIIKVEVVGTTDRATKKFVKDFKERLKESLEQLEILIVFPYPNNIGKRRTPESISGEEVPFVVQDEIIIRPHDGKLIYFQKIEWEADGRIEYRFTYYMRGYKPSRRGRWVFGEKSLMLNAEELAQLLAEAKKRRWEGM